MCQWFYGSVSCFEYRQNDLWLLRACFQLRGVGLLESLLGLLEGEQRHVYVESLLRLLLVAMSDSSSLDDDFNTVAKAAIVGCLAGEKGTMSHSGLIKSLPSSVSEALNFDLLVKEVANFSSSTFTLKQTCHASIDPYWCHWTSSQWQACEEMLAEVHRKAVKSETPFSAPPLPISASRFGWEGVSALLDSEFVWNWCGSILDRASDKV